MSPTAAERGREVRRKLLDAAVELIVERGWAAVSTRVLAERAGVAPGLVHYHFDSVQALLTEAATGQMREAAALIGPALAAARTPAEALGLLMASLDSYTGTDPMSLLFVETYLAAARDPQLRQVVAGLLLEFRAQLAAWLAEHDVPDPDTTATVLGAAIDGLVMHRAMDPTVTGDVITPVLARVFRDAT
ncbi:TetR/AcrR family transcriptional regulator [Labedaea rhizosphaerae]|uniref:TetR family transcriptional regulator n=1 Tax=Labedaea rhizosphaerae TaxID=598644 RepID=A0A4R6S9N7_LABRH|nr:TetR/AcrR family transcriptional regulator [Labedaea rhizosphaerae]TDP96511.1 TetR family transcriptional regulator [Labedaea rhizosphaerae]